MQNIKNKELKMFERVKETVSFEFDKDSTIHANAIKIADELKEKLNFRSFFIEEEFGYGKTEIVKYLKNYKKNLDLQDWTITYIDATTLEIMQDNKIGVLTNIMQQILQSQEGDNKNLSLLLSKLQNAIHRNTMGNLNISSILYNLKSILKNENHLIIFDELDRTSREFSRFLMISVGNNITAYNTKILWVLSNRERIFPVDKNEKTFSNEFEKYGQYKIILEKHDSRKIFKDYFTSRSIEINSQGIERLSQIIENKLPRYIHAIIDYIEKCLCKGFSFFESLIATMIYYEKSINNIKEPLFYKTKLSDDWRNQEYMAIHEIWPKLLFNSLDKSNVQQNNPLIKTRITVFNRNAGSSFYILWNDIKEIMQKMSWLNE